MLDKNMFVGCIITVPNLTGRQGEKPIIIEMMYLNMGITAQILSLTLLYMCVKITVAERKKRAKWRSALTKR